MALASSGKAGSGAGSVLSAGRQASRADRRRDAEARGSHPPCHPPPPRYSRHYYDLAVPGSLRLVPQGAVLAAVEADYQAMAGMIFGRIPEFADIVAQLYKLENDINGSSHDQHRPA